MQQLITIYGRLQNLILLFRIPICTRKNFVWNLQKIWARAHKIFASPVLGH